MLPDRVILMFSEVKQVDTVKKPKVVNVNTDSLQKSLINVSTFHSKINIRPRTIIAFSS